MPGQRLEFRPRRVGQTPAPDLAGRSKLGAYLGKQELAVSVTVPNIATIGNG